MKIKLGDFEFDSAVGELTIGDMEFIERQGIDLSALSAHDKVSISTLRILADVCLRKCHPEIPADFVSRLPVKQLPALAEYVRDFFARSQSAAAEGSS